MSNKTLCISGGGAKGAFAIGIIENRYNDYNKFIGTSTGSLICALLAIDKFDELKELYLNIKNEDVYDDNFYRKNGKVKNWKIIKNIILNKPSIGTFNNLLKLIRKHYTPADHYKLQSSNKELIVTVTDLSTNLVEYKNARDYNWDEFTHWIWSSALAYPFTNIYNNLDVYADGGFSVPLPIVYAVKNSSIIDCIVLDTEDKLEEFNTDNIIKGVGRITNVLLRSLRIRDIKYANYLAKENNIIITYFYTPYKLTSNSMYFDNKLMKEWYKLGLQQ